MRVRLNFTGPTLQARSSRVNDQLTVNMHAKAATPGSKAPVICYSLPGLKAFSSAGLSPHRGEPIKFDDSWFTVAGDGFYEVDSLGVVTRHGTLVSTVGRIKMAKTFTQIGIVDGSFVYIWDGADFTQVAIGPTSPVWLESINGYFLAVEGGTQNFALSGLNDGTTWAALDYDVAAASSDELSALSTTTGDVWLLGTESLEIWYFSGNADFPVTRIPGMVFDYGLAARHSLSALDSNPIWLSQTPRGGPVVVTAEGRQPRILSNDDLNWQLSQLTRIDDAVGMCYSQAGDPFYILSFPTDGVTYGLDIKTGWWHTREAPDGGMWDAAGMVYFGNRHYVCSAHDGAIYELDFATYQDNGQNRRRARRAAVVDDLATRMTHNSLEFILEVGVGTLTGDGISPTVQLRYSDDGDKTWSSYLSQPLGIQGAYRTRVVFDTLGDSYGRIYELSTHHPVDFTIIDAYLDWTRAA
jgi:hypothetical protein